jgi:hypothetical protein
MSADTNTVEQLIAAEAAANELTTNHDMVARAEAFIHEREKVVMLSVWVTDFSVMEEIPLTDGRYKGFEIIWGFHIPDGVVIL